MIKSLNLEENQTWLKDMLGVIEELRDQRAHANYTYAKGQWEDRAVLLDTIFLLTSRIDAAEAVIKAVR